MPEMMTLYRDLHASPELSGQEVKTAAKLAAQVKAMGFTVTEKVGGTGVVAVMKITGMFTDGCDGRMLQEMLRRPELLSEMVSEAWGVLLASLPS